MPERLLLGVEILEHEFKDFSWLVLKICSVCMNVVSLIKFVLVIIVGGNSKLSMACFICLLST